MYAYLGDVRTDVVFTRFEAQSVVAWLESGERDDVFARLGARPGVAKLRYLPLVAHIGGVAEIKCRQPHHESVVLVGEMES